MLARLILAVVVAVVVTLGCILLGDLLGALTVQVAITIGNFLKNYSTVIGILAGLWYFFANSATGPGWFRRGPRA
jgi:hypothetical protein